MLLKYIHNKQEWLRFSVCLVFFGLGVDGEFLVPEVGGDFDLNTFLNYDDIMTFNLLSTLKVV